jgi:4-oxalocrotonate tautomerase
MRRFPGRRTDATVPYTFNELKKGSAATMPEVYIYAIEGRTLDQKRKLVKEVTEAVARNLDVAEDAVLIQLLELSRESKAKGGVLFSDRAAAAKK